MREDCSQTGGRLQGESLIGCLRKRDDGCGNAPSELDWKFPPPSYSLLQLSQPPCKTRASDSISPTLAGLNVVDLQLLLSSCFDVEALKTAIKNTHNNPGCMVGVTQ